jgi:hypothetical protein
MNSFEKNIKSKSDAFEMQPAQGSFDLVMDALQKKKKRRFIFWLWMLIPGVGVGCGLLLINPFQQTTPLQYLSKGSGAIPWSLKITPGNHPLLSLTINDFTSGQKQNINGQGNLTKTNSPHKNIPIKRVKKQTSYFTQHVREQKTTPEIIPDNKHLPIHTQVNTELLTDLNTRQPEVWVDIHQNGTNYLSFIQKPNLIPIRTFTIPASHPYLTRSNHSRWSLGVYTELGASKNIYENNVHVDSVGYQYANIRTQTDKFLFSYSAGLLVRYAPVKFLAIETGIGFTHYKANQIISDAGVNAGSVTIQDTFLPDTVATIFSVTPVSKEYQNVYDYISIPLKVYYQKKWKWTGLEAGAGVVFDIPVHTSSYAAEENTGLSFLRNDVPSSRLNLFGIQASVNLHAVFHANQFSFFAGPVFKYRMNSMFDKNYIIEQRSYFIGGEFGARYNF